MPTLTEHVDPAFMAAYAEVCRRHHDGTMTDADWQRWDGERLAAVLRHVADRSAFYGRHLSTVDLGRVTPRTLDRLPFTTKADLRREQHAVLSGDLGDACVYYETTGTTGPPTPCPRDAKEVVTSNLHVERAWRSMFGRYFGHRMPRVALMGPSELYAFGDTFGAVATDLGGFHAKIWPDSPRVGFAKALRLLRDLRCEVVVCAPALCLTLAKAALHHGYDLRRDFHVKLFLVLGEICTPEFAANVESIWDAPVHHTLYGSQEAHAIAAGCSANRLHIARPNYLVEVVDPDTGAARGAGDGELCLTMLVDGAKPLVRYRTGDLVSVRHGTCDCGLCGPLVEVTGRVGDELHLGGSRFRPADIETAVLGEVNGCLGYQVQVDRGADGDDRLTVRLDLLPGAGSHEQIRARVSDRLGVPTEVRVDDRLDPITNMGALVSWKAARIQDNRQEPAREVRIARAVAATYDYTT
ncbi:phenylacetate--CoA ligase family protein [Dactylosporangium roseum]|uniref:Phenylacetate--CoA ligase family protein n=2 Tax=Dactylosporangium roseum TaxID=47989 RepID=A0ABY5ZDV6_9ACTN|nr:AMP-binding protein [Dactylosporangium roseum]UWZ39135.1 phenylacetate--CoA ligase family protein [Dactylosporangium roseum]